MSEAPHTPRDPQAREPVSEELRDPQRGGLVPYPLRFVAGVLLVLIGVPMLVCPGPGLLSIGAGLALIGLRRPQARRWER